MTAVSPTALRNNRTRPQHAEAPPHTQADGTIRPLDARLIRFVLVSWCAVILARQLTLFGTWGPVKPEIWAIVLTWLLVFSLGYLLARTAQPMPEGPKRLTLDPHWQARWIRIMAVTAVVGALLLVYEFAIRRGYGFSASVAEIRILEVNRAGTSSGSILGGLSRLMTPALQVAWVLATLSWKTVPRRTRIVLFTASVIVFYEQFIFEGGRNYWVCLFMMCLIARGTQGAKIQVSALAKRLLLLAGLMVFLLAIFITRPDSLGISLSTAYDWQTGYHDVTVTSAVEARFDGPLGPIYFAFAMLWLYVTQGIYQMAVIVGDTGMNHANGMHQFSVLAQIIEKVFGVSISYDDFSELINPGTYPTLIGANIVDFDIFGAILTGGALGFLTTLGLRHLQCRKLGWLSLSAPMMATIAVFSPVLSVTPNCWVAIMLTMIMMVLSRFRLIPHQGSG